MEYFSRRALSTGSKQTMPVNKNTLNASQSRAGQRNNVNVCRLNLNQRDNSKRPFRSTLRSPSLFWVIVSSVTFMSVIAIMRREHELGTDGVHAWPIVNNKLVAGLGSLESPPNLLRRTRSFLREPMPWEDGYFDPSYHVWPKNRQQSMGDKQSVKLTGGSGEQSKRSLSN